MPLRPSRLLEGDGMCRGLREAEHEGWQDHQRARYHDVDEMLEAVEAALPADVAVCVPAPYLSQCQDALNGSAVACSAAPSQDQAKPDSPWRLLQGEKWSEDMAASKPTCSARWTSASS